MKNVFIAPQGYNENDINPFTADGLYDKSWSIFIVDNNVYGMLFQRKSRFGCYVVAATPNYEFFSELMADFLQYETANNRKVIFVCNYTYDEAQYMIKKIKTNYNEPIIRQSDPKWLVHSTMLSAYKKITEDGLLKSPNRLRREGFIVNAIGLEPLGEPDDYLNYVMFATGGIAPELVVNSRICGKVNCDFNVPYTPQARMYFDFHKMTQEGIIVRDVGRKVYDSVSLEKYLIKVVLENDLTLPKSYTYWTPLLFSLEADKLIERLFE